MTAVKISPDQCLFAAEGVVQRRPRDARQLDDTIDADALDTLGVKELIRRCE
jgi:hypothetical protein